MIGLNAFVVLRDGLVVANTFSYRSTNFEIFSIKLRPSNLRGYIRIPPFHELGRPKS